MKTSLSTPRDIHFLSPLFRLSLVFLLFLAAPRAHADTNTTLWNNTGTDWATSANWGSGLPNVTTSSLFNTTFTNQPQVGTGALNPQGIWLSSGVGQDVTISTNDGVTQRTLTINGTATLNSQTNAGIILSDSANHNLTLGGNTTDTLVVSLTNSTGFYVNNAGTLTLQSSKTLNLGTNILTLGGTNAAGQIIIAQGTAGTAGSMVVNTVGTVTLSSSNGHTGGTTLTAGTLNINHNKAFGAAASTFTINGGTIDNTSAAAITMANANPIAINGNFAFTGTKDLNLGTGAVDLGGGTRTITANAGNLAIGGVISNGGLTKAGAGTLALVNANNYTGDTTVNAGTLNLRNINALQNSVLNMNGGAVSFGTSPSVGLTSAVVGGLSGSGNINLNNFLTTPTTVNVTIGNSNGQNATYSGILSNTNGNASVTKTGTNTQTFSGNNTYTGTTTISAGTLLINGNQASATGAVSVASGATLGGSGTIGGVTTINGILAPGNGIGTLNIAANTTWAGAATASSATDWKFELGVGNTADLLNITGNFLKNTAAGTNFRFDFLTGTDIGTFKLVDWTGTTGFSATDFTYTNLGGGNTGTFAFNGSQLEFTVIAVPEPQAWALLAFSLVALLLLRSRRSNC